MNLNRNIISVNYQHAAQLADKITSSEIICKAYLSRAIVCRAGNTPMNKESKQIDIALRHEHKIEISLAITRANVRIRFVSFSRPIPHYMGCTSRKFFHRRHSNHLHANNALQKHQSSDSTLRDRAEGVN